MDSIAVQKYKHDLEETGLPVGAHRQLVQVDLLSNIISAKSTVVDFGDPLIEIKVSITEKTLTSLVVGNVVTVRSQKNKVTDDFTIYNVKIDTKANSITVLAEPIFNEARNGTVIILPLKPEDPEDTWIYKGWDIGDISVARKYEQSHLAPVIAFVNGYNASNPEVPGYLTHYNLMTYRLGQDISIAAGNKNLSIDKKNFLSCIGGSQGSFLDQFHGEMEKQGRTITHYKEIGKPNRNFILSTEHQVTGVTVTTDISSIVNGVVHIFDYDDTQSIFDARIFATENLPKGGSKFPTVTRLAPKEYRTGTVLVKDWGESSDLFSDPNEVGVQKVRQQMDVQARQWNASNQHLGLPKVTIDVDFNDLEYFNEDETLEKYARLFVLNLGDGVRIYQAQLDTHITGRVSGFEYDILAERYTKMTIGNAQSDILDRIS